MKLTTITGKVRKGKKVTRWKEWGIRTFETTEHRLERFYQTKANRIKFSGFLFTNREGKRNLVVAHDEIKMEIENWLNKKK